MHFVKRHLCRPNFLAQPIRRTEKFVSTLKLAIYGQKCKLSKRTNREISLALLCFDKWISILVSLRNAFKYLFHYVAVVHGGKADRVSSPVRGQHYAQPRLCQLRRVEGRAVEPARVDFAVVAPEFVSEHKKYF
jgi:hypothetical protein